MWDNTAPSLETGFVRTPSGVRLYYRQMGGDGPVVLLLHGWPETGHAWRRVLPTLAMSGYTVVAPDLRGSGDSDKPSGGYDAVTRMEDVRALLQAFELAAAPIFVVGHSDDGASVAQAYAKEHPDEVAGLAILSAALGLTTERADWHAPFHRVPDLPEMLIAPHLEAYLRHFFQAWSHDPNMLSETDLAVYVCHLSSPGALRASLAPHRAESVVDAAVSAVPTLLLFGDSDPRLETEAIRRLLPLQTYSVDLQTIPHGGHWLPEERPDAVATALLTFFQACHVS